jgi:hypothetical protein
MEQTREGYAEDQRGKSFAGVVQYALKPGAHHKSDPVVIGGNMLGDSALELIAEFDGTKQLRQMFKTGLAQLASLT